jgi:hypothetical protein
MRLIPISLAQPSRTKSGASPIAAVALVLAVGLSAVGLADPAVAQEKKPNILVIMGDDVGWFNIGAYHQGIMSGKTPNLDKLASQGMRFTDYYAEASARRAARISLPANCRSALA